MKCNLAFWDRLLRFIFGVLFLSYAFSGGPIWGYFGFYLIFTSGWGICPIYAWLNLKTIKITYQRGFAPTQWKFRKK